MTSNNEYFTSQQIDEQIEQLKQTSILDGSTSEIQLVNVLQRYYRVPLVAEDRAALAHARQRLTDKQNDADTLAAATPVVTIHPVGPTAHPRGTRFIRLLSSLAAIILVGALIGGWLVVTHMASTSSTTVSPGGPSDLYTIHNGIAYRFEASSGKVIWQHRVSTSKQPDPRVGSNAYLQVVNHMVYAVLDFDIYALNARNGEQIWHVINHTNKSYFWFEVDNGRLYLFSRDDTFSALNATNGSEIWHNTTFKTENGYGFRVINGNLYTQSSVVNPGDQKLVMLDGATGNLRWSAPLPSSLSSAPLLENGTVYISAGNILYALKEQSGERIWGQTIPGARDLTGAYLAGGILYVNNGSTIMEFSTDARNIIALNAQTGQLLWTTDPGYNMLNIPITGGLLLAAREHNGIYSIAGLDPRTGKVAWQVPFQCAVTHLGPQLLYPDCGSVWAETINGTLYLLESDNQQQKGSQTPGSGALNVIYTLKSFNPSTGQLLSEHQLAIEQDQAVAIGASNELLYLRINMPRLANTISYTDYLFVAYRLSDGAIVWRYTMPPFPAPTSANTAPATSQPVLAP